MHKKTFIVGEDFEYVWGNEFEVDDPIVMGRYYLKFGRRAHRNYILLSSSQPVFIHVDQRTGC